MPSASPDQFEVEEHGQRALPNLPLTPYDRGTSSGHSGSETSEERSLERDGSGLTAKTQQQVLRVVTSLHSGGVTIAELRRIITTEHHGTLSGALSNLHQKGLLARLKQKRNRCQIYVAPDYVDGRETVPHGRNKVSGLTQEELEWVASCKRRVALISDDPISVSRSAMDRLIAMIERLS